MPLRSESAVMSLAMKPVSVACRQWVSMSSGISRLARCGFLQPGLQWPVGSITLVCWTTGMCQPSNQLTTEMLQMLMAGGGMQSNPSITPWRFNYLPAKCYLCVLWYYPNAVVTAVCHFKIKYNLPGLENIILLSVCSPLIDTADPMHGKCFFEAATASLQQNWFCSVVLSNFFFVYEIRKCWEQLSW